MFTSKNDDGSTVSPSLNHHTLKQALILSGPLGYWYQISS